MNRDCERMHEELIDYVEGELPQDREREIESHLAACEDCAAYVDSIRKTFSVLEKDAVREPHPGYFTHLAGRARRRAVAQSRRRRFLVFAPGIAALAVVVAFIWWGTRAPAPEVTTLEMITAELTTEDLIESVAASDIYDVIFLDEVADEMTSLDEYLGETEDIYDLVGGLNDEEAQALMAELDNLMRADEGTSKSIDDSPRKEC